MSNEMMLQPGQKGTVTYDLNIWRKNALTAFLDDLVSVEENGLEPEECRKVKSALECGANKASELPDGSFFRRAIYQDFERFIDSYEKWNDPTGNDDATVTERRSLLRKLRKRRNKLARRIRKNMQILEEELDKEFVRAQYEALNDLVRTLPKQFKSLSKLLEKILKSGD